MTIHNAKNIEHKSGINPFYAAITGAVVGAGAVVASTLALKDKANRTRLKKATDSLEAEAMNFVDDLRSESKKKVSKAKAALKKSKATIIDKAQDAKDSLDREVLKQDLKAKIRSRDERDSTTSN